jgi:hypothetical protein
VLKLPGNDQQSFSCSLTTISFLSTFVYLNSTRDLFFSRLRELHTLEGHAELLVKLKGLDNETVQQHYSV